IEAIGEHRVKPVAKAFFANLFFHLFDATQFDSGRALGFARRHACANVFLGQQFEMGTNLLVEVNLHSATRKEISQEATSFYKERHADNLPTMLLMPGRWPKKCGPIAWSRLRAASFRLWSSDSISRGGCSRTLPKKRKSNLPLPCGVEREKASQA